ncbi:MAG TPA: TIGR03618 family F420-dependent PPOX class oxidoreductase [Patescibacteria group bacterium]|nr:TIGR03618 family F420-dependent PPOX class oxidoreductase [Patescibacteria group bacterium]
MEPALPSPTVPALLAPRLRSLIERPLFATLATVDPDGAPRQAVIWYRLEDDGRIMINSLAGRRWPANLRRDGRASVAITDDEDGYAWIGLTGRVDEIDDDVDRAREDIVALAHRYHPEGPSASSLAAFRAQPRITFRIAIDGVHDHRED